MTEKHRLVLFYVLLNVVIGLCVVSAFGSVMFLVTR
jgi:hypothetical protein